jgi:hypothetical protein
MSKTVLHEILAVEQGLAETGNRITKETTKTLESKRSIFEGMSKEHEIFDEDSQHLKMPTEYKEVQSTVDEHIDFLGNELTRYWDVILQKESANQKANADVIIDGNVIVENIPAIVLLGMEKKLSTLLATYNAIPTLDAARAWEVDPTYAKPGVYRIKYPTVRQQGTVTKEWKEISPATDRHPAQLKEVETTNIVGKYTVTDFSGALSSHEKAERIKRLTKLIRAVKSARQRANNVEVDNDLKFGAAFFKYING